MTDGLNVKRGFLYKIAEKRKNQICFLVFALLSLAVMVIIFLFSNQNADASANLSGEVKGLFRELLKSMEWLFGKDFINWAISYIRKIAHFTLYTVLGAFLLAAAVNTKIKGLLKKIIFAACVGLFYSITDEFHQLFIEGRSGEITDVMIDFGGVITGIIITLAIYKIICISAKNNKNL